MANEFKIKKGLIVTGASGGTVVDIQGSQGQLFSVTDNLSGSIFAVSDISGVPIFDVNSSGLSTFDGPLTGTSATFSGDITLGDDLNFTTNGFADISNTGTGAMRFKPSSQTLALTLIGANATFAGNITMANAKILYTDDIRASTGPMAVGPTGEAALTLRTFSTTRLTIASDGDATFTEQAFSAATSSGDASSTLTTKGYVDGLITGATIYRGTWDPDVSLNSGYGNPDLSGVTQTSGYYYICSADGAATPNGTGNEPDSWNTGDWVIWNDDVGASGEWQKIDNSSVLSGVGTGQTVALWQGASSVTDSETLGNAPITVSGNNATFAGDAYVTGTSNSNVVISRDNMYVDAGQLYIGADNATTNDTFRQRVTSGSYFIESRKSGTWTNRLQINSAGTLIAGQGATFAGTVLIDGVSNYTGLEVKGAGASRPQIKFSNVNQGTLAQIYGTESNSLVTTVPAGLEYQVRNANGAGGDHVFKSYNTAILTLDGGTNNATFAGEIRTANRLAIKETYFGYSSGYKVIQVGESAATKSISLGYDPSGNTSGSFSGNEILIPNNIRVLAPAANNSGYYGLMMLNSSNKVLLGSSNYLMESNYIMALDPATKNVGIGTASPSSDISGSVTMLEINDATNNNLASLALKAGTQGSKWEIAAQSSNALGFFDDGTERMRIDSSGYVNIKQKQNSGLAYDILINLGTSPDGKIAYQTPTQLVDNLTGGYNGLTFADGTEALNTAAGCVIATPSRSSSPDPEDYQRSFSTEFKGKTASGSPGTGSSWIGLVSMSPYRPSTSGFYTTQLGFGADGTNGDMFIRRGTTTSWGDWRKFIISDSSGNTTFAGSIFLDGFTNPNTRYISLRESFVPSASGGIGLMAKDHSGSSNDGLALYGHDGVSIYTAQTERVRINADGTTKFNANILADVINNSANSANIIYRSGTTTIVGGGSSSNKLYVLDNGDVGVNDSSPSYKLDADGTIRATGDVIAYSDRRVKENIKTIDNALNKVLKLRGVSYNRKDIDDKSTKIGVIAQEVLETIPEVVEKDLEGKYSVAYGNMAGLFIEAIKELKAEIEELKLNKCNCNK